MTCKNYAQWIVPSKFSFFFFSLCLYVWVYTENGTHINFKEVCNYVYVLQHSFSSWMVFEDLLRFLIFQYLLSTSSPRVFEYL